MMDFPIFKLSRVKIRVKKQEDKTMDQSFYTQFDELPRTLCATDIAAILNISRSNAYMLLRREDFPTLHIGKRMLTPKHRFIQWIEENTK